MRGAGLLMSALVTYDVCHALQRYGKVHNDRLFAPGRLEALPGWKPRILIVDVRRSI